MLPNATERQRDIAALTALTVILLFVDWLNEMGHLFTFRLDALTYYIPWYTFLGEQLRAGNIPGWLPATMSGVPFAGDPQSGWGYMPAMVLMTLVPGIAGFKALIIFHLLLGAGASYAFARIIGMNAVASFAVGLVFSLNGLLERLRCCTIHAQVAVWVPVAFIGIEVAARQQTWLGRAIWWTLTGIAVSQMIAGWIGQGAAYGMLTVAAYAFYRIVLAPPGGARDWAAIAKRGVAAAAVIGLVSGVLAVTALDPRLDVVDRSNLAGGSYSEVGDSAEQTGGWSVALLVARSLNDEELMGRWYIGSVALAVAMLAVFFARRRFQLAFFVPFSLVVYILILHPTPIHQLFYLIPTFQQFHEHRQDRILTVFPLALAVMVGAVVAMLPSRRGDRRYAALAALPLVVFGVVWLWRPLGQQAVAWFNLLSVAIVAAAIAAGLLIRRREALPAAMAVILLLLIWDPAIKEWVRQENYVGSGTERAVDAYEYDDGATRFLKERMAEGEIFRYFGYDPARLTLDHAQRTYHIDYRNPHVLALVVNNRAIGLGLEDVQGYNPIQIQRYSDFLVQMNGAEQSYHAANVLFRGATSPLLNLLNVRYMIVPREPPPGRPDLLHLMQRYPVVYTDRRVAILERTDGLPRAWIAHSAIALPDEAALDRLADPTFDPNAEAILVEGVAMPPLGASPDPAAERVEIVERSPDRIELRAELNAPGIVVLSEIWDPDWHVEIDGEEAELLLVDTVLRGVAVPSGAHTIVVSYRSSTLLATAAITAFGWIAVLLGALTLLIRRLGLGVRHHDERETSRPNRAAARLSRRSRDATAGSGDNAKLGPKGEA